MLVQSFLVQGTGAAVATALSRFASTPLDALVLFSLGAHHPTLLQATSSLSSTCPVVYLTETYGIIGFDEELKQNIELMEKGRGSEYGFKGGSGGQGCLVTAFSGGAVAGHTANLPLSSASTCMVISDASGAWWSQVRINGLAPLHYGGITKECWKIENGELHSVPYFWVADTADSVGVSIFGGHEDAGKAATALLSKVPSDKIASGDFGLFPCFTRGVNQYDAENVESSLIAKAFPGARIFGMFAHGELGPGPSFSAGFPSGSSDPIPCTQHSMCSILSIHTMLE